MRAETVVVVALDRAGRSVIRQLRCEPPLLVRESRNDAGELVLLMVNGAAGPLGGDCLSLVVEIGDGARAVVRSVGASMAQPSPHGTASSLTTRVVVGAGGSLDWRPESVVSVRGSDHRSSLHLACDDDATVELTETISLGRNGEDPGRLALHQRVVHAGRPVLDHETVFGVGALATPGAHGSFRAIRSTISIGPSVPTSPSSTVASDRLSATYPLALGCALSVTTATSPLLL
jgi:urease accessory protein